MLRGSFGPVHPFQVKGWAYDSDDLSASLEIEVRLDGRTIGRTRANLAKDDAGPSERPASHDFLLTTGQALPIYELHRVAVTAIAWNGRTLRLEHRVPPRPTLRYPLPASDVTQHPVFILGSVRSASTAVMESLASTQRYVGPGEGHLLDLLMHIAVLINNVYAERRPIWDMGLDTLIAAVPESFMVDGIRHVFVELASTQFPNRYWFDKTPTPTMIRTAPLLLSIWPEAKFIFLKRRGIENVLSRLRRCPEIAFDDHCRGWSDSMISWSVVRDQLGSSAVEVEHLDIAHKPSAVARMIGRFLVLTAQEESAFLSALASKRPERSTEHFAAVHDLEMLSWTREQVASFRRICGEAMRLYGYGETRTYRLD